MSRKPTSRSSSSSHTKNRISKFRKMCFEYSDLVDQCLSSTKHQLGVSEDAGELLKKVETTSVSLYLSFGTQGPASAANFSLESHDKSVNRGARSEQDATGIQFRWLCQT
ncbi:hypothetical protein RRG08_028369 [Elysia crispata]|uniref:Uncharacterized protein n=1 Tax=Elysia crispata TaxID=231223 RepID=A0AAE1AW64_9GAST|nr:hypothetical protein RRG08_028369 [Elysia crispata]